MNRSGGSMMQVRVSPVVRFLLFSFPIVYVLQHGLERFFDIPVTHFFGFAPVSFLTGSIWQALTYSFLHGQEIFHILFNCMILYMLGPHLERLWGPKKFLSYFFVSAMGGALLHTLIWMGTLFFDQQLASRMGVIPVIGASGALYGLMYAFSRFFGDTQVMFMFIVPMTMRRAVIILVGIDILQAVFAQGSNVAHLVHIGGFAMGWLYMKIMGADLSGPSGGGFFKRNKTLPRAELKRRMSIISNDKFDNQSPPDPSKWN